MVWNQATTNCGSINDNINKLMTKHYTKNTVQSMDDNILIDIRRLYLPVPVTPTTPDDHFILPPQHTLVFKFPFLPHISLQIKKQLTMQIKKFFPNVQLRIIFKPSHTIRQMFPYKDCFPLLMKPNVVYKYVCDKCELSYVGSTSRCLMSRSLCHAGLSPTTMVSINAVEYSNIRNHTDSCVGQNTLLTQPDFTIISPTSVNFNNFSVLSQHSDENALTTAEALHIHFEQPPLNSKTSKTLYTVDNSKYSRQ